MRRRDSWKAYLAVPAFFWALWASPVRAGTAQEEIDGALAAYREASAKGAGGDGLDVLAGNVALAYYRAGQFSTARTWYTRLAGAAAGARALAAPAKLALGELDARVGKGSAAADIHREALAEARERFAASSPALVPYLACLGRSLVQARDLAGAREVVDEALDILDAAADIAPAERAAVGHLAALVHSESGAFDEVETSGRAALDAMESCGAGASPAAANVLLLMAMAALERGERDAAADGAAKSLALRGGFPGEQGIPAARAKVALALARAAQGRDHEAFVLVDDALAAYEAIGPDDGPELVARGKFRDQLVSRSWAAWAHWHVVWLAVGGGVALLAAAAALAARRRRAYAAPLRAGGQDRSCPDCHAPIPVSETFCPACGRFVGR